MISTLECINLHYNHSLSYNNHSLLCDWLSISHNIAEPKLRGCRVSRQRVMNLGPGAGNPDCGVPRCRHPVKRTLWSYRRIMAKSRGLSCFIVYYYFHPRWVNRLNRLAFGSSFNLLTHTQPQIIMHNKTLVASAYSYILYKVLI